MGKALYRKYRSRSLGEIVGQGHITETLGNALKSGKFAHAYLLTGPRGTGKTSVARILAHEINQLPYSEDPHFDIIEIDAASNNGVEDVRELREKVQSAPASAKYKVYIIDEVHMLSKPAFNALLKTLEEPPAHVIFILATTEVHKLPETIISRTQRFSFRPVPYSEVVQHLRHIATEEHIDIEDDALNLIAEHGEGSFRDSISLLDQASSLGGTVTAAMVEQLLGRAPHTMIEGLVNALAANDTAALVSQLRELYDHGFEPAMIAVQLGRYLRSTLNAPDAPLAAPDTIDLLKDLINIPPSHQPAQLLELSLLSRVLSAADTSPRPAPPQDVREPEAPAAKTPPVAPPVKPAKQPAAEQPSPEETAPEPPTASPPPPKEEMPASTVASDDITELWNDVLQTIKQTHNTLYGIARMAKPSLDDNTLTLATKFPFHQKRLSEAKNRDILARCVTEKRGTETSIVCVITESGPSKPPENDTRADNQDISTISNIFGGAELI